MRKIYKSLCRGAQTVRIKKKTNVDLLDKCLLKKKFCFILFFFHTYYRLTAAFSLKKIADEIFTVSEVLNLHSQLFGYLIVKSKLILNR